MPKDLLSNKPKDLLSNGSAVEPRADNQVAQAPDANLGVTSTDRLTSLFIGGLVPAAGGAKDPEDTLPIVTGALGAIGGGVVGHPNLGLVLGS